ncbi:MAG TPA: nuclear transport factor 2 family protein [Sphingomicrobium sp.]|nr:nuclear transport factor 2 family protein [Sphingomicrobium sp.]
MKRFILILGTAVVAQTFAAPVVAAPVSEADRKQLEQLAAANDEAWGARDVAAMSSQYVEESSVRVSPQAPVVVGRGPVTKFFGEAFARRQGVHRHVTMLDHVELVAPDMALADAGVRVERQEPNGSWSLVRTFRNISLAIRERGQWKLRSVRAIPQN